MISSPLVVNQKREKESQGEELGFEGRVAVITGAGGGLGRSHALELADRGARVVVDDLGGSLDGVRCFSRAGLLLKKIIARGGEAVANHDSVATPEGGAAIVQQALDAFGRVDIVINNAGILRDKSFHNMTAELIDPVLDVHLKGAFNVTRPAYEMMRRQRYGRILSTASAAGVFGNFGQANYREPRRWDSWVLPESLLLKEHGTTSNPM